MGSSVPLAATATVTFTAYSQINYGDKVTLRATSDPSTDIDFTAAASGTNTWDPGSSNNAAATALAAAIDGHANFSASADSAVVTITQGTTGLAGNTTVTLTDTGDPGMTSTSFVGGGPSTVTTTFVAQSTGTTGSKTTSPVAFSDAVNSRVYGCALVAYPDFADKSQDLVLSRFYFDSTSQIDKSAGSNIGISWPITLS